MRNLNTIRPILLQLKAANANTDDEGWKKLEDELSETMMSLNASEEETVKIMAEFNKTRNQALDLKTQNEYYRNLKSGTLTKMQSDDLETILQYINIQGQNQYFTVPTPEVEQYLQGRCETCKKPVNVKNRELCVVHKPKCAKK